MWAMIPEEYLSVETTAPVVFRMTTCQEFMNDSKKKNKTDNKPLYLKPDCSRHLETASKEAHERASVPQTPG